jgi:hypothetical protein
VYIQENNPLSENRIVFIFGLFLISSLFFGVFISTAQAATVNTTMSEISVTPNPAGLGYQISVVGTISPQPPSGYSYRPIVMSTIDRNGNYRTISTNSTQPGSGTFYFSWIPDITGDYQFIFTYPGETLAGNVYTRCQRNTSFSVDQSLPTPAPTSIPTQTPAPESNNSSTPKIETSLNINCQSSTTYSNFKVNIQGTLKVNNAGLSDSPIQLSYSVDGGNSWIPLTFLSTDYTGAFQAVWTPLVTGTYFLRATYEGNSELSPASTIVHFAVLPVEDTSVFSVASNSTVTGLAFNSTSQTLGFKVSGETGTTGYVNVYISKSLMNDTSNLAVYFDQELLQPVTQSMGDSWLVSFTYHHSVHTVALALNSDTSNIQMPAQNLPYITAGVASAFLVIAVVIVLLKSKTNRKNV